MFWSRDCEVTFNQQKDLNRRGATYKKEICSLNQVLIFLRCNLSNKYKLRAPIQFEERKNNPSSSRTDQSIFTSITPELFDQTKKQVQIFQH